MEQLPCRPRLLTRGASGLLITCSIMVCSAARHGYCVDTGRCRRQVNTDPDPPRCIGVSIHATLTHGPRGGSPSRTPLYRRLPPSRVENIDTGAQPGQRRATRWYACTYVRLERTSTACMQHFGRGYCYPTIQVTQSPQPRRQAHRGAGPHLLRCRLHEFLDHVVEWRHYPAVSIGRQRFQAPAQVVEDNRPAFRPAQLRCAGTEGPGAPGRARRLSRSGRGARISRRTRTGSVDFAASDSDHWSKSTAVTSWVLLTVSSSRTSDAVGRSLPVTTASEAIRA